MKNIVFLSLTMVLMSFGILGGSLKTEKLLISGNCEMCKETIELNAMIKGVKKADWDIKSHYLTVSYDSIKVTKIQIEKSIAKSGYDTPDIKSTDEAYQKLPKCCQYKR